MAWDDGIDPLSMQEPAGVPELHKRLVKGLRQRTPVVLKGKSVNTGTTAVVHGQRGGIPRFATVTARTAVAVGCSSIDATFVNIEAASACVVDILLEM